MAQSFPTSNPSYPDTTGGEILGSAGNGKGLSAILNDYGLDITAISTKLGTGDSTASTGKVLRANGSGTSVWGAVDLTADVTGTLPTAKGGTGTTTLTFPAGTDTLVGRATTDTLTNKTIGDSLSIQNGNRFALTVGADLDGYTLTDATRKFARVGICHYLNAEEPLTVITGDSTDTYSRLIIGGGTSFGNAATEIQFKTAADTTTTSGTTRATIDSSGLTINSGALLTDTISEKTSAAGVTIDSLKIKDGKLATDNSVVTANITAANVTAPKLGTHTKLGIISAATLGTTGDKAVTGLGFIPRIIRFTGLITSATRMYIGNGVADGTTQYAVATIANASAHKTIFSTTECIIAMDSGGTQNSSISLKSIDADGFTVTVNDAMDFAVVYEAFA